MVTSSPQKIKKTKKRIIQPRYSDWQANPYNAVRLRAAVWTVRFLAVWEQTHESRFNKKQVSRIFNIPSRTLRRYVQISIHEQLKDIHTGVLFIGSKPFPPRIVQKFIPDFNADIYEEDIVSITDFKLF